MPAVVVGRDTELAALTDFLAGISGGAAALVLEGEAGMGKTTLWNTAVAEARADGIVVLEARPTESETELSFAGLGDLLDGVLSDVLVALPAAQRRALSRALVLDDDAGPPPDPHAVGVAVQSALRAIADRQPVVVAVDDVQWLDAASVGALSYAGRRLRTEHVGILLARRSGLASALVDELGRTHRDGLLAIVDVGPLAAGELHSVVREHLGVTLPRPLLAEVHDASGGNPFFAIEIVRALRRTGVSVEAGQPVPVPESLHDLVNARLLALPAESRDYLLAAAAHAYPRTSIVEAVTGIDRAAGLLPALDADIVALEGNRIRFTHPLLAAGAYDIASPLRRREVHARLAELLEDPEARAWQLAASVDEPDEAVAVVLEEAAWHARTRGAPRSAAVMLDRACELTPQSQQENAVRRAIDGAYLHFESGDSPRAEIQLSEVVGRLPRGAERARALMRFARVRSYETQDQAADLFLQAIDEADGDSEILAVAHEGVATCLFRLRERLDEAVEHAELAAGLALELGEDALAAEALGSRLLLETLLGRSSATETANRALALQHAAKSRRIMAQPLVAAAVYWWWTDSLERARAVLTELLDQSRKQGDESSRPYILVLLGQVECAVCDFENALGHALEGQVAAEQSGQHTLHAYHLALEALVEAQRGNVARARVAGLDALERVPDTGGRPAELLASRALAHLELVLGAPDAAFSRLEPCVALVRREAITEPSAIPFVVDQIEALIELGRREEAAELLGWYEGNSRRLGRASAIAACLRCDGLLAAQEGAVDSALSLYADALEWHARVEVPLDRARTLLALGTAQRRMKRRRDARTTLEEALATFERIGAALWAERARGELKRISGRAATPGALTPAEERVAALVAEGRTNREVAAALFLSDRTVEGHLAHIFGKLRVRNRTEIGAVLAARQTQGTEASKPGEAPVSAEPSAP